MNVNVKRILDYLKSLVNVTCIIVSHDSMLIEQVVTHMLEIKNFKLKTSRASFPSSLPSTQKLKPISTSRRPPCLHISRSLVTLRA
jgi:elongation factor 3